mgnify:CR=1 FL=1
MMVGIEFLIISILLSFFIVLYLIANLIFYGGYL